MVAEHTWRSNDFGVIDGTKIGETLVKQAMLAVRSSFLVTHSSLTIQNLVVFFISIALLIVFDMHLTTRRAYPWCDATWLVESLIYLNSLNAIQNCIWTLFSVVLALFSMILVFCNLQSSIFLSQLLWWPSTTLPLFSELGHKFIIFAIFMVVFRKEQLSLW